MKKAIFIFILSTLITSAIEAQTSFSCTYREYCHWNQGKGDYEDCQGYEENSLFVMSENETMFTHTTETIKSTYYVTSNEYNEEKDIWTYDVTSDVGNDYYYIFDPKNNQIRAVYTKDGETLMVVFTVKAVF